jgi:SAM-dependent methyltransferase
MKSSPLPCADNIAAFSVSRLWHFDLFKEVSFRSFNTQPPDPAQCDLKVYQDYLIYLFLAANVPKGARVLEVGGGDSRVLKYVAQDYECWNLDKCEGLGNGPHRFTSPHYRMVYDYIGTFNAALPDHYFDFVFSISALEHTPEEPALRENIVKDLRRVTKPGAPSFHLFDCVLRTDGTLWVNGLLPFLERVVPLQTHRWPAAAVAADPTIYFMSEAAFQASWARLVGRTYQEYGRPFSMNAFWLSPAN